MLSHIQMDTDEEANDERTLHQLTAQLQALEDMLRVTKYRHDELLRKHSLLHSIVDILQLMLLQQGLTQDEQQLVCDNQDAEGMLIKQQLRLHAMQLASAEDACSQHAGAHLASSDLDRSSTMDTAATDCPTAATSHQVDGCCPPGPLLGPPGNPLALIGSLCKAHACEMGDHPPADIITVEQYREFYISCLKEVSLHMVLLDNQLFSCKHWQQHPSEAIKQVLLRFLKLWIGLVLYRTDFLYRFCLTNCITGATVIEQDVSPYQHAVHNLDLSQQQVSSIAQGTAVFRHLQQNVLSQLQSLQQQQQQIPDEPAAAAHGSAMLPMGILDRPSRSDIWRQRHAEQQELMTRVYILLRKHHMLGVLLTGYTMGSLTAVQLARLAMLCFPFMPITSLFAEEVAKKYEQQQAQQEQEQGQHQERSGGVM